MMGSLAYLLSPLESLAAVSVFADRAVRSIVRGEEHQTGVGAARRRHQQMHPWLEGTEEVHEEGALGCGGSLSRGLVQEEGAWEASSDVVEVARVYVQIDCKTSGTVSIIEERSATIESRDTYKGRRPLAKTYM